MPKLQHRRFDGENSDADDVVADSLQNIDRPASSLEAGTSGNASSSSGQSTSEDDDDDAPEAIQASLAKSTERARLSKLQSAQSTAKQAKRKSAAKSQNKQTPDRKGKGKAVADDFHIEEEGIGEDDNEENNDEIDTLALQTVHSLNQRPTKHQVFDSDNEEEPSTSAQRLDPALFQQAEAALQQAKDRAIQEQKQQRLIQANEQEGRFQTDLRKRSRKRGQSDGKATKVIGDVTIQQLASNSNPGEANIDSSTAMTSKYNENFLKDRLFKRKRARLTKSSDKAKKGDDEKPFLLFDPLVDKPKKKQETKPLTRAEMEERLRFRKSAQTAFSKSQRRSMGPSVAFGAVSSARGRRAQ